MIYIVPKQLKLSECKNTYTMVALVTTMDYK